MGLGAAEAKDEYSWTQGRIFELEDAINRATVIEAVAGDAVTIGCRIRVEVNGREKEFTIVGSTEVDALKGRISNESPIGKAFMGRKVGAKCPVKTPSGERIFTIMKISWTPD